MEFSPLLSFEFSKIKFLDPRLSTNISKWIVSSLDISQVLCYVNPRGRICGHFILLGQCWDVGILVKDGKKGFKEGIYFFIFFLLIHRLNLVKKVSMKVCFEITLNHYKHPNVEINRQHLKGLTLSECLTYIYLPSYQSIHVHFLTIMYTFIL